MVERKDCNWVGDSRKQLKKLPADVVDVFGYALDTAQCGGKSHKAKPLKGIGPGILEIVENHDGDTYRAVYTVKFKQAIYVLHVFQKKSKKGIATPPKDMNLIKSRMADALADYSENYED